MEKRIVIAGYIILFVFSIFVLRLWNLQVIKGGEYKAIDERNRLRVIDIPAPRGIIYDRNNTPLVKNVPSFDISIVREDLPKDVDKLSQLSRLIGIELEDVRSRISGDASNPYQPIKLKQNVSFEDVAKIEARKIDFPGLQVDVVGSREYIYGASASHVIGYLGRLSLKQLKTPEYRDLPRETFIGRFGTEKSYDRTLRGIAGKKIIEVDAVGSIIKVVRIQRPIKGSDITLTIDINLQIEAEKKLRGKAGAIVAIKPDTGEILALASAPSFDPNLFVRGINYKDWQGLIKDPRKPLLNRAIQSQYPPGSTFKIISAIAALEEGFVTDKTPYYCNGSILFGRVFRCWKKEGHGSVAVHQALVESCDVYFYEIAKKIDIDSLAQYALGFGLGRPTGIELKGEVAGIVPTKGWKRARKRESWYRGETLNTIIGQGYLSATPIQMARMTAAVVNGGNLYRSTILKKDTEWIEPEGKVIIRPENMDLIRNALVSVVEDKHGTGHMSRSKIVRIGGKTGTTQVVGGMTDTRDLPYKYRDHAWFVAFAPADDPQIAVAVLVEHGGHGSSGAAPLAKNIIEEYLKRDIVFADEKDDV